MRVVRYHTQRGKRNAFCGATPDDSCGPPCYATLALGAATATGVCSCPQLGWTAGQKYATTLLLYLPGDPVSTSATLRASLVYEPEVTGAARDDARLWFRFFAAYRSSTHAEGRAPVKLGVGWKRRWPPETLCPRSGRERARQRALCRHSRSKEH